MTTLHFQQMRLVVMVFKTVLIFIDDIVFLRQKEDDKKVQSQIGRGRWISVARFVYNRLMTTSCVKVKEESLLPRYFLPIHKRRLAQVFFGIGD